MKSPIFLSLPDVLEIHKNQIDLYGGQPGVRDISLLASAVAMPEATFSAKYLHKDLFEMAAAYVYHICQNHPFVDGNKRAALVTGLIFLELNGTEIKDSPEELYQMMISVASGKVKKEGVAAILKKLCAASVV